MTSHMWRLRARARTARRGDLGRGGGTLLIVVVALVALMGAAAATVDVGQMLMIMSHTQALADACALAAGTGPIIGHGAEVQSRIQEMLAANAKFPLPATWNPDELVYYNHGATVPGYGSIGATDEAVTLRVRITGHYTFGRVLGLTDQVIERRATALRTAAAGGDAIMFAMSPSANDLGIDLSGSRGVFEGSIHSNTKVDISGSSHHFMGLVEWNNRLRVTGSGHAFDVGDLQTSPRDPPVSYQVSDFEPFDHVINGDYNVSGSQTVPPGCYRVHGDVHVSGSGAQLQNVTFVADGEVQFSGSNHYYTPNRLGVFAYSLSNDSNSAIRISGAAPGCRGTLYAPAGGASFSGSNMTYTSIIAWTIDISGSDFHILPSLNYGGGEYTVKLVG